MPSTIGDLQGSLKRLDDELDRLEKNVGERRRETATELAGLSGRSPGAPLLQEEEGRLRFAIAASAFVTSVNDSSISRQAAIDPPTAIWPC